MWIHNTFVCIPICIYVLCFCIKLYTHAKMSICTFHRLCCVLLDAWHTVSEIFILHTGRCVHVSPNEILWLGQLRSLSWLLGSHRTEIGKCQTILQDTYSQVLVIVQPLKVAQTPGWSGKQISTHTMYLTINETNGLDSNHTLIFAMVWRKISCWIIQIPLALAKISTTIYTANNFIQCIFFSYFYWEMLHKNLIWSHGRKMLDICFLLVV